MSKIDPGTLGWVKTEIDETLKQARLALEAVAENPSDTTSLRFCNTYLHQVLGTLQMVELDGAAMLAQENEALAEAILNGKVQVNSQVLESLGRGILSVPDYLARLQDNQPDVPLRLLPVINELRSARGAEPIAELDLFTPDLAVRPPARPGEKPETSEDEFLAAAKTLRPQYQTALLGWLRDPESKDHLSRMAEILARLEHAAYVGFIEQLFWVAGGLLDALVSHDLQPTNDRKKLLGRIDQQIKKFIDGNDKSQQLSVSEALVKSMLFQLGEARSTGGKVGQIKRAFSLDALLTGEAAVEAYDMPAPEALNAVSDALEKEITAAQEMLSAYFDTDQEEANSLEPLIEILKRMSGTLGMLDIGVLKALVDELIEVCRAIVQGQLESSEAVSMPMARALLLIESSSRDVGKMGASWKQQIEDAIATLRRLHAPDDSLPTEGIEITDAALSDAEFRQLLAAVAGEIRVNLGKVEEVLETFAGNPDALGHLEPISGSLNQIQGALQIVGQDQIAEMTALTNQTVVDLQSGSLAISNAVLDALAVAVGTIGAYIEGLERDRPNLGSLLSVAWRELDSARSGRPSPAGNPSALVADIHEKLDLWLENPRNSMAHSLLLQDLHEIAVFAGRQSQQRLEKLCNDMSMLLEMVAQDPDQSSDSVGQTLRQSAATLDELARAHLHTVVMPAPVKKVAPARTGAPERAQPADSRGPVVQESSGEEDDFDEEIMEIFIEDAREMIQIINNMLPQWEQDPENKDVLLEVRRAFHTLKGSGRMVGAGVIAELAWAVENMLNRVREGKIDHSEPMFSLLHQVQAALPLIVEHLKDGSAPDVDVDALRASADILTSGGTIEMTSTRAAGHATRDEVAEEVELMPLADESAADDSDLTAGDGHSFDPVLLQIFSGETKGHLATLESEALSLIGTGHPCMVSDNLLRSAHTLQGGARALGLQYMAESSAEMEKLFQAYAARQQPVNAKSMALVQEVHNCISRLVDALNSGKLPSAGLQNTFADVTRKLHSQVSAMTAHEQGGHAPAEDQEVIADTPAEAINVRPPPKPAARTAPPRVASRGETGSAESAEEVQEDVDPELLEIFMEEAVDILASVEEALNQWRGDRRNTAAVQDLKRSLHTLKGGARMAGAMTMGNLSHNTETLLKEIEDGRVAFGTELLDLLDEVHDALSHMIEQMQNQHPVTSVAELNAKVVAKARGETTPAPVAQKEKPVPRRAPTRTMDDERPAEGTHVAAEDYRVPDEPADETFNEPVLAGAEDEEAEEYAVPTQFERRDAADAAPDTSDRRGQIRVRTSLLSNLVNYAGEVSISRSRMQQQIFGFRENMAELNRNITRFREQIRELEIHSESQILYRSEQTVSSAGSEFDPLEFDRFSRLQQLSRGLAESLHDLYTIQSSMDNFVGQAETVLQQQARVNTDLQEGLMRTRMISFSTQAARLRHMVRQTSRELGKSVELELTGTEVEVDRTVLERMIGPFEHMVRNAIDHGLESEAERKRAGKPPVGRIIIKTSHEGTEIVIRFSDDGAGLNIDAIRRKAIEGGLMESGTTLSDEEIMQFILVAGFSTANKVTHLSGRGVGMDVVHNEVKQLGGSITVDTQRGAGTTFVVRLPLTLSIAQALMVYAGESLYAIPLSSVVNLLEVPVESLNSISVGKKPFLNHEGEVYPFMQLASRLGMTPQPRTERKVPVMLARSGSRQVAIQIDGLAGTREVVIKPVGPQLSHINGLSGATILGDGRVVLILDIPGLWISDERMHVTVTKTAERPVEKVARRPVIMVVDDSITVRKVTSRYLTKNSMDVITAKDGLDAVEQLREQIPDVMLVDIEMPRMDGYELTRNVRSDPGLKHIPIIMITSRAGSKHRERALQLGVNLYMTKPYNEEELLTSINAMLTRGAG